MENTVRMELPGSDWRPEQPVACRNHKNPRKIPYLAYVKLVQEQSTPHEQCSHNREELAPRKWDSTCLNHKRWDRGGRSGAPVRNEVAAEGGEEATTKGIENAQKSKRSVNALEEKDNLSSHLF